MKRALMLLLVPFIAACGSKPPAPDWKVNAQSALERGASVGRAELLSTVRPLGQIKRRRCVIATRGVVQSIQHFVVTGGECFEVSSDDLLVALQITGHGKPRCPRPKIIRRRVHTPSTPDPHLPTTRPQLSHTVDNAHDM